MTRVNGASATPPVFFSLAKPPLSPFSSPAILAGRARSLAKVLLVIAVIMIALGSSFAQTTATVFGTSTPVLVDSGDIASIVVGVKIFSDVPGQVLGCSFYKAPLNTGAHVVSLWDSAGKLLASKTATNETTSGKQTVIFASPVPIAANQVFTCGYFAPGGHYSHDRNIFTLPLNAPPLHIPINGGVFIYGTVATAWPTGAWLASNYWVDVLFAPSAGANGGSSTWISGAQIAAIGSTVNVTWTTAVPSDSQVEFGPTVAYGNTTTLAAAQVTAHSVPLVGLVPGTAYHFRVRSRDSDTVLVIGVDHSFAIPQAVSVATSPSSATIASSATQQFTAMVSNASNATVTWAATAGTITSSGLFTAPIVSAPTAVTVTAISQADTSKTSSATLTVNPLPALTLTPASLSFSGQVGASNLAPASVSITSTGAGSLAFTEVSDQPWLVLSSNSRTTPSTLQVNPSVSGLTAGTYTGHVTVTGGGVTKALTVVLTVTAVPVKYSVSLSWKGSTASNVASYSMYRSTMSGNSYGLVASAIGSAVYSDQTVQSATTYYYVVTAVNNQGQESGYSNEIKVVVP
jgi:hypothetical protein